jgi:DNA mismatch repair protein MutS
MVTAIRIEDSLRDGISYFQAEARRVRDMARPLADGLRCLIIADELFRGTNVRDACDASLTVLRTLAAAPHGRAIVASHLTEVAADLVPIAGSRLMRFEADLREDRLSFDYRLGHGVSAQRLGMMVLRREGVLDALDAIRQAAPDPDRHPA